MPETMDGQLPLPVPTACPVTLEALLEVGLAAEEPRLQAYPQQTDLSSAKAHLADWIDLPTRSHVLTLAEGSGHGRGNRRHADAEGDADGRPGVWAWSHPAG